MTYLNHQHLCCSRGRFAMLLGSRERSNQPGMYDGHIATSSPAHLEVQSRKTVPESVDERGLEERTGLWWDLLGTKKAL